MAGEGGHGRHFGLSQAGPEDGQYAVRLAADRQPSGDALFYPRHGSQLTGQRPQRLGQTLSYDLGGPIPVSKDGLSFSHNPLVETARRQRHGVILERRPTEFGGQLEQGRLEGRMGDGEARPVRRQAEDHGIEAQPNHLLADCAVDLSGRAGALYGLGGLAEG